MYTAFLQSEVKKWTRDPMMFFMLVYPLVFGAIGRYLLPWLAEGGTFNLDFYADLVLAVLALMVPVIFGAVLAFSILDDRDDHVLMSVKVTPLSINQFLSFRVALVFALSFVACAFVMWFVDVGDLTLGNILAVSFLASLTAPMYGLVINALASNKIEGFAVMKGLGMVMLFPIIALFFFDYKEIFFAIAPGFWPAKVISTIVRGEDFMFLTYNLYYFIGVVYALFINFLAYNYFLKRTRI